MKFNWLLALDIEVVKRNTRLAEVNLSKILQERDEKNNLSSYSEKVQKLAKFLHPNPFGCENRKVKELVSILVGEEIPNISKMISPSDNNYLPLTSGTIIVMTDTNEFSKEKIFITDDVYREGIGVDRGRLKNIYSAKDSWRFATNEEVDKYFKQVSEKID